MDLSFERRAWTLVYLCLGVIEGGTAAVMVRALFVDAAPGVLVDVVLAVVSAAPAWANLASLAFARRVQGQPKIAFLQPLLIAMTVCVAALAWLPATGTGLLLFVSLYGIARILWCGVDTVRAVLWSANYPRRLRARITGRIAINTSIALAGGGLMLGWLLEHDTPWYRAWILAAAGCGLMGAVAFRRFRVRQEEALLAAERARLVGGAGFSLAGVRELLTRDASYRRYMYAMSLFGAGNLMLIPVLVVCFDEVLHLSSVAQIAVTTAVPVLVIPIAIQPWAAYLDRHHVVAFRSVHGWVLVSAAVLLGTAVLTRQSWLLWPGAMLMGVSLAAASLGWSLGHNDFAPRGEETRYMALHVSLTGLRGLLAPPLVVAGYHGLEYLRAGLGPWALVLPVALIAAGAREFTAMDRGRTITDQRKERREP
jgi:hypothetical protein